MGLVVSLLRHFAHWLSFLPWWEIVKTGTPVAISLIALLIVLYDRRAHLELAAKKGKWCILDRVSTGEVMFRGLIDVYNSSSRANAIRDYQFVCQLPGGDWREMDSEQYQNEDPKENGKKLEIQIFNQTALTLAPYSGMEIRVQAFVKMPPPYEMTVKIIVKDQFGKQYHLKVKAEMK